MRCKTWLLILLVSAGLMITGHAFAYDFDDDPVEENPSDSESPAVETSAEKLTLQDLVRLSKAGIKDETIIDRIVATQSTFKLTADDLVYLKENGVSDTLIDFLTNTPTMEQWEKVESEAGSSSESTLEDYVTDHSSEPEVQVVYRHIYADLDYWDTYHPDWYWDTYWSGVYPIGFYYYNGCYNYYFGMRYAHLHHHSHYYNYDDYGYKPPRRDRPHHHYRNATDDHGRYKGNGYAPRDRYYDANGSAKHGEYPRLKEATEKQGYQGAHQRKTEVERKVNVQKPQKHYDADRHKDYGAKPKFDKAPKFEPKWKTNTSVKSDQKPAHFSSSTKSHYGVKCDKPSVKVRK